MNRRATFIGLICLAANSAGAQDLPPYRDDRSDAAALVRSLYNAIDRGEYARAWSYFSEEKPAGDFDAFVKGYADTARVEVETGQASEEGAAGSIYFMVPTAIRAIGKDGKQQVFAGCYTARLLNPAMQESDFRPLHLERGELRPVQGELNEVLPESCGDALPPPARDALLEQARQSFAADFPGRCQVPDTADEAQPESHELIFRRASDADDAPERKARLFRFHCSTGAYNTSEVYYFADDAGQLRQLHFATPELDIRYEDDNTEGRVEHVGVIGYAAADELINSSFDASEMAIQSLEKWRGTGDVSASGKWIFRNGAFTLVRYEVDATYDGQNNPEAVLDFDSGP